MRRSATPPTPAPSPPGAPQPRSLGGHREQETLLCAGLLAFLLFFFCYFKLKGHFVPKTQIFAFSQMVFDTR